MDNLIKSGLLALALGLLTGSSAATMPASTSAALTDPLGRAALAAINSDIQRALHEESRRQLLVTLPAELASSPLIPSSELARAVPQDRSDAAPARIVVAVASSRSRTAEERAPLRWQSLLPGMMK